MYRLGIDIGGTKINIGIFDQDKNLLKSKKVYIFGIGNLMKVIKNSVLDMCSECAISYNELISCGVGVPATVDEDGRRIMKKAPNIEILSKNLAEELEEELDIPVRIIQDSRAAAWGEYLMQNDENLKSLVCVTLGTGIGTGIVLNGEIYRGSLGCAGEMGHIPVVENGRPCGCGKNGCIEKYCAGGGLDITAKELLGEGKTATDLFNAAKDNNVKAKAAIDNAIEMLGRVLVSIINLLSPDCMLISGGLSSQEELYMNPLIEYVKSHCYKAENTPDIKKAKLGELSPLFGAAFMPMETKRKPVLSASIMCADILNMDAALKEIKEAGIKYLHCDIMDNHFVPNLMLPMELLNKLRIATDLPFDVHIMAENPETIIEKLVIKENDIITVHYESTIHLQKLISLIKEKGAKAGVAINPATPIEVLSEVMEELDMILIMSVNPGFASQKIVKSSFDKIKRTRNMLSDRNLNNVKIEVDGNCSFENVPKMYKAGADIFVVGTSSVFRKDMGICEATQKLFRLI